MSISVFKGCPCDICGRQNDSCLCFAPVKPKFALHQNFVIILILLRSESEGQAGEACGPSNKVIFAYSSPLDKIIFYA